MKSRAWYAVFNSLVVLGACEVLSPSTIAIITQASASAREHVLRSSCAVSVAEFGCESVHTLHAY